MSFEQCIQQRRVWFPGSVESRIDISTFPDWSSYRAAIDQAARAERGVIDLCARENGTPLTGREYNNALVRQYSYFDSTLRLFLFENDNPSSIRFRNDWSAGGRDFAQLSSFFHFEGIFRQNEQFVIAEQARTARPGAIIGMAVVGGFLGGTAGVVLGLTGTAVLGPVILGGVIFGVAGAVLFDHVRGQ